MKKKQQQKQEISKNRTKDKKSFIRKKQKKKENFSNKKLWICPRLSKKSLKEDLHNYPHIKDNACYEKQLFRLIALENTKHCK